ncbi:helix-turn-helix transcriptional regulator [Clostridium perfringens]|nr:helix-turn-helix transcriptional regulator [Clostridium perfringens]MDK0757988.1 helix-turn-helix transcriptional regulator [Clostridium perfringens]
MIKILKEYRRRNNLTQKELAEKLNISRSYLCELEHRVNAPSYGLLVRISNTLKICPLKLLNYYSSEKLNFNCCKYGCYTKANFCNA